MTTQTLAQSDHDRAALLRTTLRLNAGFSILSGGLIALEATQVAAFLGLDSLHLFGFLSGSLLLLDLGIGVVLFGLAVGYVVTRPTLNQRHARLIFVGDLIWIALSAVLLLTSALPLSTAGRWAVLIVADLVGLLALGEYLGLRRLR